MNRSVLSGLTLASLVLSLGLVGCGESGEEGLPKEIPKTAAVPIETLQPDMVKQTAAVKALGAGEKAAAPAAPAAGAAEKK